jgi:queuosine precursor transporter
MLKKYFTLEGMDRALIAKMVLFHTFIIALSNYLVTIKFDIWGIKLTWAAFTFPLVVVATDLTIRLINKENARAVVNIAFIPAIIASIIVIKLGGAPDSVAIRVGIASGLAYLVSSLLDVYVFQKVRERVNAWYAAPALAAVFANVIDTFTFFGAAFYQSANTYMAENWHIIAMNQTGTKLLVSLAVILPVYGVLLNYLSKRLNRNITGKVEM